MVTWSYGSKQELIEHGTLLIVDNTDELHDALSINIGGK